MKRKHPLANHCFYHIYSRSIAKFIIFRSSNDYGRLLDAVEFYRSPQTLKFSDRIVAHQQTTKTDAAHPLIDLVCFCIMPTHIHFILLQRTDRGISRFMHFLLNSYSHYFNIKYHRQGPLWSGPFQSKLIQDDQQLLVCSRYIHRNPFQSGLVDRSELWEYSSLQEYERPDDHPRRTQFEQYINIVPQRLRALCDGEFVE